MLLSRTVTRQNGSIFAVGGTSADYSNILERISVRDKYERGTICALRHGRYTGIGLAVGIRYIRVETAVVNPVIRVVRYLNLEHPVPRTDILADKLN